jgi:hypothetical protein
MDLKEKQEIVKQIRMLCELQYRKGFQQGYDSAKRGQFTSEKVQKWRFKGSDENYKKITPPCQKICLSYDVLEHERISNELRNFLGLRMKYDLTM